MRFKQKMGLEAGIKQIEITPLIDCVFLLLIFFMLTSHFVVAPGIKIALPQTAHTDAVEVESVTITVSSEDILYVGDSILTRGELENYLKNAKPESVFIKADRESSLGAIASVWDACKGAGIEKIGIATTEKD